MNSFQNSSDFIYGMLDNCENIYSDSSKLIRLEILSKVSICVGNETQTTTQRRLIMQIAAELEVECVIFATSAKLFAKSFCEFSLANR